MSDLDDAQKAKLLEMLETWEDAHRAIRVLKWLGRAAKWVLGIGASIAMIWAVIHGGRST